MAMSECANFRRRITIALTDTANGWIFRLHNDDRRVWLDSLVTDAPVPIAFIAGAVSREFETAIGNSNRVSEMIAHARRLLPKHIIVSELAEVRPAA